MILLDFKNYTKICLDRQNCLDLLLWALLCFIFLKKTGFCPVNYFNKKGLGEA